MLFSNENFINELDNNSIDDFMVDLGRLKSPLSDTGLLHSMIKELWEVQDLTQKQKKAVDRRDFEGFLDIFHKGLVKTEDISEKAKVKIVRLEEALKSVEVNLNGYRRKLKKISKKDKSAIGQVKYVESLLEKIKKIKRHIIDESKRSITEQRRIARNV